MAPTSPGRRGSVRQDDNSTWSYTVDLTLPGSQRRQTRKRGFLTRKVAQAALTETLAKLQDQSYVPPSRLALRTFIEDTWLPAVAGELRPSTLNSYSRNLRLHVLPALGSAPLQSLDASTLTQHYQRLVAGGRKDHRTGTGLSTTTVRSILRSALQTAYEWDLVPRNVADRAKPPKPRARGDRHIQINTWSTATLAGFLRSTESERLHPLWMLLATTGLRRGEAIGLTWSCLDPAAGSLSVRRSLVDVDRGQPVWSDPKTSRGRRVVALDTATLDALAHVWVRAKADKQLAAGTYHDHDLVFTYEDGTPLHPTPPPGTSPGDSRNCSCPASGCMTYATPGPPSPSNPASTPRSCKNASATPTSPSPWTSTATSRPRCSPTPPSASPPCSCAPRATAADPTAPSDPVKPVTSS